MTRAERLARIVRESQRKAPRYWLTVAYQARPEPYAATARSWRALNPSYPGVPLIVAAWAVGEVSDA